MCVSENFKTGLYISRQYKYSIRFIGAFIKKLSLIIKAGWWNEYQSHRGHTCMEVTFQTPK